MAYGLGQRLNKTEDWDLKKAQFILNWNCKFSPLLYFEERAEAEKVTLTNCRLQFLLWSLKKKKKLLLESWTFFFMDHLYFNDIWGGGQ